MYTHKSFLSKSSRKGKRDYTWDCKMKTMAAYSARRRRSIFCEPSAPSAQWWPTRKMWGGGGVRWGRRPLPGADCIAFANLILHNPTPSSVWQTYLRLIRNDKPTLSIRQYGKQKVKAFLAFGLHADIPLFYIRYRIVKILLYIKKISHVTSTICPFIIWHINNTGF